MTARIQWLSPSPLWNELYLPSDRTSFRRPALLRFATDEFIEELQAVLENTPSALRNFIARYEDWRNPSSGMDADNSKRIRMYQPVHQRFYLVTASLACRLPGLPDHTVRLPEQETATFILRRRARGKEYAWVAGDPTTGWTEVSSASLAPREEQLPMFPVLTTVGGRQRRVWAGLIPASRKQTYSNAQIVAPTAESAAEPAEGPRADEWTRNVFGPWFTLVTVPDKSSKADSSLASAFILIDFAEFLQTYLPNVWSGTGMKPEQGSLRTLLVNSTDGSGRSLLNALQDAWAQRAGIEPAQDPAGLPGTYTKFKLDDAKIAGLVKVNVKDGEPIDAKIDASIRSALAVTLPIPASSGARVMSKEPDDPNATDTYTVRCVYTRPQCGTDPDQEISDESEPFELVGFFDPAAPARNLQVELPIDVSPRTLSKYDRNVAFAISDQLSQQMDRVKSLKDMADGTFQGAGPGLGLGWICSLSIPIITICAFILLLIIVIALNIIFWWLPFFKICLPVPKRSS